MAIIYNPNDHVYYGTNAERTADTAIIKLATAKFYELDTGDVYITNGSSWIKM